MAAFAQNRFSDKSFVFHDGSLQKQDGEGRGNIRGYSHPVEFGRRTSGDLLCAELTELGFEVLELLLEIVFALAPELTGADFWS